MLAYAVGLAPWKDNHWTMSVQPGNRYSESHSVIRSALTSFILGLLTVAQFEVIAHCRGTLIVADTIHRKSLRFWVWIHLLSVDWTTAHQVCNI